MAVSVLESPKKQNWYYWRLIATAISFATFGVGGLILGLIVFPLLRLIPGTADDRVTRHRKVVYVAFRLFVGLMKGLGVLTYEIHGAERLNRPNQLVIANHPSLIDVVFLISRIQNTNCIVKGALFSNPFTRGPVSAAGYVSSSDPEKMIDDCVRCLKQRDSLVIFPEATRTTQNTDLRLKRGAAYIALRARPTVTPVRIHSDPPTLSKEEKWYEIPYKRVHFTLTVGDDLPIDDIDFDAPENIQARRLTQSWQHYFTTERSV